MKPVGNFARAEFEVMNLSQQMQGRVMDYINDVYFAEEELNINNLTYERFMREYEKAQAGGDESMSELNRQLAGILSPIIDQFLAAPVQEAQ